MVSFMAVVTLTAHPLWHMVSTRVVLATHSAGYLNFATAVGAMAIHGHGGNAVVTVIRGAGDVHVQC